MICLPAHGAVIGAWFGAFPMPLDWERPWQVISFLLLLFSNILLCVYFYCKIGFLFSLLVESLCVINYLLLCFLSICTYLEVELLNIDMYFSILSEDILIHLRLVGDVMYAFSYYCKIWQSSENCANCPSMRAENVGLTVCQSVFFS